MARTEIPLIVKEHTGSAYTITTGDYGAIHTNRGGGALTYTLPTPSDALKGVWFDFFNVAAGDTVLSCSEGLALLNNATADTFTMGQANEEIGNGGHVVCDGSAWLVFFNIAAEAATTVVGDS
jgi:hypothetical protein